MLCHICNNPLGEITIDPRDGSIEPCDHCRKSHRETMDDYLERDLEDGQEEPGK